jgi:hypothetical protein
MSMVDSISGSFAFAGYTFQFFSFFLLQSNYVFFLAMISLECSGLPHSHTFYPSNQG